jgi:hypothetical protein
VNEKNFDPPTGTTLENSSDTVGAAAVVVDEEVLVSVGLVGVSSPQLTDRARAAINM